MSNTEKYTKQKPRKDSFIDFNRNFGTREQQIDFFITLHFPHGFICDRCQCRDYYLIKRKGIKNGYILECADCGYQYSLLEGTIFQDSNLDLYQILIGLYLFFTANKGISAPDMANRMDVSVKTARRYLRKFRILMADSNNDHILDSQFYEADIIEVGGRKKNGQRGRAADKSQVLLVLATEQDNRYPTYMKLHVLPGHKAKPIEEYMTSHIVLDKTRTVTTDSDASFKWLNSYVNHQGDKVDYTKDDAKMYWLNIFASNFENNIKTIYHGVARRDLPLYLAEQEWRENHRYTGKYFMEKVHDYLMRCRPMTNREITDTLDLYKKSFLNKPA